MVQVQKSFEHEAAGAIYLVPTPIGNLEDITFRALNILKQANVIAAEDTRNTKKLLNHFDIHVPLTSFHEHTKQGKTDQLIEKAKAGAIIAVVSDAGMPAISDPGSALVTAALAEDVPVVVLPGANAALTALVGSGLSTDEFYFYGFLPRKKKEKQTELARLKNVPATLIFYESPFRVKETLKEFRELFGTRRMAIARELTKRFEEYVRGTVDEILTWAEAQELKGEFVLVVEGSTEEMEEEADQWWRELGVVEHAEHYIREGLSNKDAMKQTAADRGVPKRTVYQAYHIDDRGPQK